MSLRPEHLEEEQVHSRGEHLGIPWVVAKAPMFGALNGYVRLPEGHPWHGLDYEEIEVDVHGGVTYHSGGWIGFDTLHFADIWPGSPEFMKESSSPSDIRWTAERVQNEVKNLARQVAEHGA